MFTVLNKVPSSDVKNCPVLVTGGAKRIGRAIVEDLAAHGFPVVIHCQNSREEGEQLARLIEEAGGKAGVVQADLTDEAQTRSLYAAASAVFGPIRLLINNASQFDDDRIGTLDMHLWDRHFAIHLKTPVLLAEEMHLHLPAEQDGLIVNMIDQRVWKLNPMFFSYTLSKAALLTATRTLAQALAPRIRVNAIAPGPTLPSERQSEADFARQVAEIPLQQAPQLQEFGATIRYYWQNRSITGQMIALDGGQHLNWQTPDIAGLNE